MERRLAVHAGSYRQALIVALALAASPASAAPKNAAAKKLFDKGVAAFTKGDYAAAATALSESYAKEKDVETLFAWAQSERKQNHCSNAVELYNQLLAFDLPAENKTAIQGQISECKDILDKEKPVSDSRPPTSAPEQEKPAEPVAQAEAPPPPEPEAGRRKPEAGEGGHAWWKDPLGDTLVIGGVVALGFGTVMMVSASSASSSKDTAGMYSVYSDDVNTAHDRGLYGVIGLGVGGALVVGGIIRFATNKSSDHATVTGYVTPNGGGAAVLGRF